MEFEKLPIEGLFLIKPNVFNDPRGTFFESYNEHKWGENLPILHFKQDNVSSSKKGVLRGLHFQAPPYDQGKLVQVLKGSVLDVAVDIRKNSPSYGQYYSIELNERNRLQFYIPPGFAHGFLSLEDDTIFHYKCTNPYHKESEGSILWNDPNLNIDWGVKDANVSEKDKIAPLFSQFKNPF